ncbi:MAG: glycosyltransferase [Candidatus Thorarchaeota archaeon]
MANTSESTTECEIVFEISNEIGNKIGGIYTVIASKATEMQKLLGPGNYLTIGLYNAFKVKNDFEELSPSKELEEVISKVRLEGIEVKYGLWLGGGNVECFLVDPSRLLDVPLVTGDKDRKIDLIKGQLWDLFQIDSLWMAEVFDPMVAFGWSAGILISHLIESPRFKNKRIAAQFHEWISGPGLLYLKKNKSNISTIFMTHATQLGRNIAMGEEDINEVVDYYLAKGETIPPQKAYQYQVEGTHQLEVVCAENADLLVTVSEAVAREAECMLGRKPDFIIPNGINFENIAKENELNEKYLLARLKMNKFIEAYFNPYYQVNTDNLLIIHISGRYEFHNKGIDVFLESLKKVNEILLTSEKETRDILAFIWVPAPVSVIKTEVSKAIELAKKQRMIIKAPLIRIEEWLTRFNKSYRRNLEKKNLKEFFTEEEINNLTDLIANIPDIKSSEIRSPPICPFRISERDTIFKTINKLNLINKEEDKVKIIFYPTYLSKNDNLLELDYYDAVAGCDMGIYPSIYEPFGLTPLEALALGVPAVTTDLAGFGLLVNKQTSEEAIGIHVLKRRGRTIDEAASKLAEVIIQHSELTTSAEKEARILARQISEIYSWHNIIKEYKIAFDKAIQMKNKN